MGEDALFRIGDRVNVGSDSPPNGTIADSDPGGYFIHWDGYGEDTIYTLSWSADRIHLIEAAVYINYESLLLD